MNKKPFHASKAKIGDRVVTRSGLEGRIICLDRVGTYPVIVLIKDYCHEDLCAYTENGSYAGSENDNDNDYDIFFPPQKVKGWVSVYLNSEGCYWFSKLYATRELADTNAGIALITVTEVEFEV